MCEYESWKKRPLAKGQVAWNERLAGQRLLTSLKKGFFGGFLRKQLEVSSVAHTESHPIKKNACEAVIMASEKGSSNGLPFLTSTRSMSMPATPPKVDQTKRLSTAKRKSVSSGGRVTPGAPPPTADSYGGFRNSDPSSVNRRSSSLQPLKTSSAFNNRVLSIDEAEGHSPMAGRNTSPPNLLALSQLYQERNKKLNFPVRTDPEPLSAITVDKSNERPRKLQPIEAKPMLAAAVQESHHRILNRNDEDEGALQNFLFSKWSFFLFQLFWKIRENAWHRRFLIIFQTMTWRTTGLDDLCTPQSTIPAHPGPIRGHWDRFITKKKRK